MGNKAVVQKGDEQHVTHKEIEEFKKQIQSDLQKLAAVLEENSKKQMQQTLKSAEEAAQAIIPVVINKISTTT